MVFMFYIIMYIQVLYMRSHHTLLGICKLSMYTRKGQCHTEASHVNSINVHNSVINSIFAHFIIIL